MATRTNPQEGTGAVQRAKVSIREMVSAGDLVPGQRLIEPDLVTQLGISRLTLREAFSALEAEGLLKFERFKGASVRPLNEKHIIEAFEVRELLEGLAARRAAEHFGKPALRSPLVSLFAKMEASVDQGSVPVHATLNREFHEMIVRASHSEQLASMEQYVLPPLLLRILQKQMVPRDVLPRTMGEHREVYEALLAGNGQKAELAMRKHIRSSLSFVRHAISKSASSAVPN